MEGDLDNALKSIFNNKGTNFSQSLFELNIKKILQGVDKGFGKTVYGQPSFELLQNLRESAIFFVASKTFVQAKELSDLLVRPDGTIKPWTEYLKAAKPLVGQYNGTWLKTEYDAAVRSARAAKDFKKAQDTVHLYPNLKYMPSLSANPRDTHKMLYGIVRPVNDAFWSTHLPPSDWNCKCSAKQTTEEVTNIEGLETPEPVEAFAQNPARTGRIFTPEHPYFKAVGNLDENANRLIDKAFQKIVKEHLRAKLLNKTVSNGAFNISFSMKGIKEAANQPNQQKFKKLLLMNDTPNFMKSLKEAEYLGSAPNTKPKNYEVKAYHYFKINLGEEAAFIVTQERQPNQLTFYSIIDHLKEL